MIEFILFDSGAVVDRDNLSAKAAKELIEAAVEGLCPDPVAANQQVTDIWMHIMQGGTARIENPKLPGNVMVFQNKRANGSG